VYQKGDLLKDDLGVYWFRWQKRSKTFRIGGRDELFNLFCEAAEMLELKPSDVIMELARRQG